ncbi:MarR family transcriptional regulator [Aliidongia dinghuensis]|uniref:MarR family transcriptional regulator n=1 Tax=Aliidongia dinghuensis TaxID=1867774 RepID=A0A8J2Z1M6_9PROT|nr:MarR family winged helix-turn-helix transcriptional regulator [Aliidongia dinghuensis]GGF51284.1 MarR family transcriptional regulator [Aliidongia dinghuensis]
MKESYLNLIALVERLHRQFLELVRTELDSLGVQDINNVQALILFNIGEAELTVGELTLRGCYLGSNVSYNVKKMVENGYLVQERSPHDRRSIRVRVTPKGLELCAKLDAMHDRHIASLNGTPVDAPTLETTNAALKRVDRFWTQIVDRGVRVMPRMSTTAA